jgi:hypothetical protein
MSTRPRAGLINAKPQSDWCELDKGKIVGGEFVLASGHTTALLGLVEEPLDQVAGTVKVGAETDRFVTICFSAENVAQTLLLEASALIQSASSARSASSMVPDFRRDRSLPASRS